MAETSPEFLEALRELIQKRPYDLLMGIPAPAEIADEAKCAALLREVRWPQGVTCPFCSEEQDRSGTVQEVGQEGALKRYRCLRCGAEFNDRTKTLFRDWPLTHWFYGLWLMAHGLTKHDLAPLWGVHYGTADLIMRQVRRSLVASRILERLAHLPPPVPPAPERHERPERPSRPAPRRRERTSPEEETP